jgi:hypothetical protein
MKFKLDTSRSSSDNIVSNAIANLFFGTASIPASVI